MKYFFLSFFLISCLVFSQEDDVYNLDYNNSSKVAEICTEYKINSFNSNAEADQALSKILSVVGASKRFVIAPCENINNDRVTRSASTESTSNFELEITLKKLLIYLF